jgi:hypothetical protein
VTQKLRSRSHSPHYEITQTVIDQPCTISQEPKQELYVPIRKETPDWT